MIAGFKDGLAALESHQEFPQREQRSLRMRCCDRANMSATATTCPHAPQEHPLLKNRAAATGTATRRQAATKRRFQETVTAPGPLRRGC
jgi:hypothetical protein